MNNQYPYTKRNLLENKENYHYSKFLGKQLLNQYISSRKNYIKYINDGNSDFKYIVDELINSDLNTTCHFLIDFIKSGENEEFVTVIQKKFEITKRVYDDYDLKNMRKISDDFSILNFILLSASLVDLFKKTQFLGYLNSILKLNDIICSIPFSEIKKYYPIVNHVLKSEISFIEKISSYD